ncbi:zincin [Auricularia subglabra TFB-10046 SS5]|nr:zincin [Auricularia subglabra TFB-10046 SS5]
MDGVHFCTRMPVSPGLQAQADMLAVQDNPRNAHSVTAGGLSIAGGWSASLALPIGAKWANGRTSKVKILNDSAKIKEKIRQYANLWSQHANITFNFVGSGDAEIRVNNEFARVIIHEFGHALGCIHEHQSPAAGIPWNREAVYVYYERTVGWTHAQTGANIFQLYAAGSTQFSGFDTKSIMLYAVPAALTTNGFSVGWNDQLSDTDKAFIAQRQTPPRHLGVDHKDLLGRVHLFNTLEDHAWNAPQRRTTRRITFARPYAVPPKVILWMNALNMAKDKNWRFAATTENITATGFSVNLDTWSDSAGVVSGTCHTNDVNSGYTAELTNSGRVDFPAGAFDRPRRPPTVLIALNAIDSGTGRNMRAKLSADGLSVTGMNWHIDAWVDSLLYSVPSCEFVIDFVHPCKAEDRVRLFDVRWFITAAIWNATAALPTVLTLWLQHTPSTPRAIS